MKDRRFLSVDHAVDALIRAGCDPAIARARLRPFVTKHHGVRAVRRGAVEQLIVLMQTRRIGENDS